MRLIRFAPFAALALLIAPTLGAQIPSGARRLGAPVAAAPKLMVATPYAFVDSDSSLAVSVGNAVRSRMERVAGSTYRVWLVPPGSATPVGDAAFDATSRAVPLVRRVPRGARVAVTLEPSADAARPSRPLRLSVVRE